MEAVSGQADVDDLRERSRWRGTAFRRLRDEQSVVHLCIAATGHLISYIRSGVSIPSRSSARTSCRRHVSVSTSREARVPSSGAPSTGQAA